MNWQQMNKDQKQKAVLIGLVAVLALAALYQFVLLPALHGHAGLVQKRDDLRGEVEKAQMLIHSEVMLDKQSKELRKSLEQTFSADLPPPDNALSWASQLVTVEARKLGLEVSSIADVDAAAAGWDQPDLAKRSFKPYSVRVELSCGFDKARNLVRSLQQGNPLLAITGISIQTDSRNIEKPVITMIIEWPSWRDPKKGQHPFESGAGVKQVKEAKKGA